MHAYETHVPSHLDFPVTFVSWPSGRIVLGVQQPQHRGHETILGRIGIDLGGTFGGLKQPDLVVRSIAQDDVVEVLVVEVVVPWHTAQVDADVIRTGLHGKV